MSDDKREVVCLCFSKALKMETTKALKMETTEAKRLMKTFLVINLMRINL